MQPLFAAAAGIPVTSQCLAQCGRASGHAQRGEQMLVQLGELGGDQIGLASLLLGRQPVLRQTGGAHETTTPMMAKLRNDIRAAAELTSDGQLAWIAELAEAPVSLESCRRLDRKPASPVLPARRRFGGDPAMAADPAGRHHCQAAV